MENATMMMKLFINLYKLIVAIIIICDMVPSRIFPVKPVFGVITKMATILAGSKYHLTEGTQNLAC